MHLKHDDSPPSEQGRADVAPAEQAVMKRNTTLYVMILASILQSTMSLVSLASYAGVFWRDWAALATTYSVQQRSAWGVAALWSMTTLVASIAALRGRAWGRKLYASGAAVAGTAWFALLPWTLASSAVPPIVATIAALYSKAGDRHLNATRGDARQGLRSLATRVLFVASIALLYSTYLGMFLGNGWMDAQFGDRAPQFHFLVSLALLVAATLVAPRGARAWHCGVALMVFVVAITAALIGFVPYTASLARYLGPAFRPYEMEWGAANFGVTVVAIIAWLLLVFARRRRNKTPPPHGDLPDFA
ncbi:hypothetical protein [Burkholderia sp. F1]|uniref:hypothetical protein n=1 Tax=Burkholderia sp. F1 TaxID=3366817 RepID=UPI003D75BC21